MEGKDLEISKQIDANFSEYEKSVELQIGLDDKAMDKFREKCLQKCQKASRKLLIDAFGESILAEPTAYKYFQPSVTTEKVTSDKRNTNSSSSKATKHTNNNKGSSEINSDELSVITQSSSKKRPTVDFIKSETLLKRPCSFVTEKRLEFELTHNMYETELPQKFKKYPDGQKNKTAEVIHITK
jgi:hypothetical protein